MVPTRWSLGHRLLPRMSRFSVAQALTRNRQPQNVSFLAERAALPSMAT